MRRVVLFALIASACDFTTPAVQMAREATPPPSPTVTARASHPAYSAFVNQIEAQHARMKTLLEGGQLDQIYAPAEQIGQLARKLPPLVQELPEVNQADVRIQIQNLQGLYMPVVVASKNGDREETARYVEHYAAPIAALKRYL
jgi:hypothetical protein